MQASSVQPINTFTIGFEEQPYDEARHANQVAAHLGTNHTELYVRPSEVQATIAQLPEIHDEPFAGLVADSDLSHLGNDEAKRHRGAVR